MDWLENFFNQLGGILLIAIYFTAGLSFWSFFFFLLGLLSLLTKTIALLR